MDRLTGPELSCFVPETRGWPADIGVIAILDGAGLPTTADYADLLRAREDVRQSRGENVAGLVLRAMVPVSLHDPSLGLDRSLSGLTGAAAMTITPPAGGSPAA